MNSRRLADTKDDCLTREFGIGHDCSQVVCSATFLESRCFEGFGWKTDSERRNRLVSLALLPSTQTMLTWILKKTVPNEAFATERIEFVKI
jgi:hypothetical protein